MTRAPASPWPVLRKSSGQYWLAGIFAVVVPLLSCISEVKAQSATLTTLVSFDITNGALPYSSLMEGSDGNFYGTTAAGGTSGVGTVFRLMPSGLLTTLVSFNETDGNFPSASVIEDDYGNFYGTTLRGGDQSCLAPVGCGTVFELTPAGALTTLASFNGTNGQFPVAGLVQSGNGNFYGTTQGGGDLSCDASSGCGTVFELTPSGTLTTLVAFDGTNGRAPAAGLIQGSDNNFYGTTDNGGDLSCNAPFGCGTIFKLTPSGAMITLASFNGTNGNVPIAALIQGSDGNFYGTTAYGGDSSCVDGCGTVFKITPTGILTTLVTFHGTDGEYPRSSLIQGKDGNFYGTTTLGGNLSCLAPFGCGTVFELTPSGVLTTLVSFNGSNGELPYAGLIQASDGSFYGSTGYGGDLSCAAPDGCGTVFKLSVPIGPPPPSGLTATAKLRGKAALAWTASTSATSYNVYEGPSAGQESSTPILTGITRTKATVKKLTSGQAYCFTVAGVDAMGVGLASNEACITAQ